MLFTPVDPVPAEPPSTGLLASAQVITPPDNRWQQGFAWYPERCFQQQGFATCATTERPLFPASFSDDVAVEYYQPFALRVFKLCTTRDGLLEIAQVRRQLEAGTSFGAARELWAGDVTQNNTYTSPLGAGQTNRWLTSAADTTVVAAGSQLLPAQALGALEGAARAASNGQDVYIHMPPQVHEFVAADLIKTGRKIYTQTGSTVVVDAAYDGAAPGGGAATLTDVWMYATGPVQMRVGEIVTTEVLDHKSNARLAVAERVVSATFDPCIHFAIAVRLPGDQP